MPTGLPPNLTELVSTKIKHAIDYFEIPAFHEIHATGKTAFYDSLTATKSICALLQITTKPLLIFLSLILHYLFILLRIVAEHSVQHGIVALKEAARQSLVATKWFFHFQKNLSTTWIIVEIGCIGLVVLLYAVRRYIRKKRYVQRIQSFYRRKKYAIKLKYDNIVHKVAQTSMLLALLLPHVLYITIMTFFKYTAPSIFRYFATQTILTDTISFYYPIFKTIMLVRRWRFFIQSYPITLEQTLVNTSATTTTNNNNNNDKRSTSSSINLISSLFSPKSKSTSQVISNTSTSSSVADKYLAATQSRKTTTTPIKTMKKEQQPKSKTQITKHYKTNRDIDIMNETDIHGNNLHDLINEASTLLKYWVVYAFVVALYNYFILLPFVGRVFSNYTIVNTAKKRIFTSRNYSSSSIFSRIKLSVEMMEEIRMTFYIWLTSFSILFTNARGNISANSIKEQETGVGTVSKVSSQVKQLEGKKRTAYPSRLSTHIPQRMEPTSTVPLDILFHKILPLTTSIIHTSEKFKHFHNVNNLHSTNHDENNQNVTSFVTKIISWLRSFLDVMVWTKLISESFKNKIISTAIECTSLSPVLPTLFMPSYFTTFGVIYASLVVPASNTAQSYKMTYDLYKSQQEGNIHMNNMMKKATMDSIRFLRYWILYAILSCTFSSFAPVLAWVPLSTHFQLCTWVYVQIESVTEYIFGLLEWELMMLGLFSSVDVAEGDDGTDSNVDNSYTFRLMKSIIQKLPSLESQSNLNKSSDSFESSDSLQAVDESKTSEGGSNIIMEEVSISSDSRGDNHKFGDMKVEDKNMKEEKQIVEEQPPSKSRFRLQEDDERSSNLQVEKVLISKDVNVNDSAELSSEDFLMVDPHESDDTKVET